MHYDLDVSAKVLLGPGRGILRTATAICLIG